MRENNPMGLKQLQRKATIKFINLINVCFQHEEGTLFRFLLAVHGLPKRNQNEIRFLRMKK